jgi:filamentous hemagglutinin
MVVSTTLVVGGAGNIAAGIRGLTQSMMSHEPSASQPVGGRGQQNTWPNPDAPKPRNSPTNIGGREFSGHAVDRMQERGIPPSAVENAIKHGTASAGHNPGTTVHWDPVNKINVITDAGTGRVITVW